MKITRDIPYTKPLVSLTSFTSGSGDAPSGHVPTSLGSNGGVAWGSNVATITANGSNLVLGPFVNLAAGSNITLAVSSNTMTITGQAGGGAAVSFGSNSTHVTQNSSAGASSDSSRMDHYHAGIGTITASSSNTMQRGTWNIRPGTGIALSLTDSDGDGAFDTATIVNTGVPGPAGTATFIGCRLTHSTTQNVSTATLTALVFDTETYDTSAFHSTVTNTGRITIPTGLAGRYIFGGTWRVQSNTAGYRRGGLLLNGATYHVLDSRPPVNGESTDHTVVLQFNMSVSDYMEVWCEQTSGGTRTISNPFFWCQYLGPA